jgi:hypothetical protein
LLAELALATSRRSVYWSSVLLDGDYLRFLTGVSSYVLTTISALLGLWATVAAGGSLVALSPAAVITFAALGALDALAGVAGWLMLAGGALVTGQLRDADHVATAVLFLIAVAAMGIVAGRLRPMWRSVDRSFDARWNRAADVVVASAFGGFVVSKVIDSLPLVAHEGVRVAADSTIVGATVAGILALRYLLATYALRGGRHGSRRWAKVHLRDPQRRWRVVCHVVEILVVAVFATRLTTAWWVVGPLGALYFLDLVIPWNVTPKAVTHRLAWLIPRGLGKVVVASMAGSLLSLLATQSHASPEVVLAVSVLGIFAIALPVTYWSSMRVPVIEHRVLRYGGGVLLVVVGALQLTGHLVA